MPTERNMMLDLIRSLAAFFVVLIHVTECIYGFSADFVLTMSEKAKIFAFSAYTLGRIGVPLFLLLTGYLVLGKEFTPDSVVPFYKHSLLPLFSVWEVWVLIYYIYLAWFNQSGFDFIGYFYSALFLKHVNIPHVWYMPMILGMYLFLPFVSMVLHKIGNKLVLLLSVTYLYVFVVPSISVFQNALGLSANRIVSGTLDLSFGGYHYGFYLVLGYCLAKLKDKTAALWQKSFFRAALLIGFPVLFFATVYLQILTFKLGAPFSYGYTLWYNFFTMPLLGVVLFIILCHSRFPQSLRKPLRNLSADAFGIYLLHELLLLPILRQLGDISDKSTAVLVLPFLIYFACVLMIRLFGLIPGGHMLFLRKADRAKSAD